MAETIAVARLHYGHTRRDSVQKSRAAGGFAAMVGHQQYLRFELGTFAYHQPCFLWLFDVACQQRRLVTVGNPQYTGHGIGFDRAVLIAGQGV